MIINSLLAHSFWWLVLILCSMFIVFYFLIYILIAKFIPHYFQNEDQSQVAGVIIQSIVIFYGIVLGFTIVMMWEGFDKLQGTITQEANQLANIIRNSSIFTKIEQNNIKQAISDYIVSVRNDEWETMKKGIPSEKSNAAILTIYHVLQSFNPDTIVKQAFYHQSISALDELLEARRTRLDSASHNTPLPIILMLILGSLLVLGVNPSLMKGVSKPSYFHSLSIAVSCLLAINLSVIIMLNYPFADDWGISNKAFTAGILASLPSAG